MTENAIREQVCEIGRQVYQKGFVAANDGNFSVRLADNRILTTPTGISKGAMRPEQLVVVDMMGRVELGSQSKPSSELLMHLFVYRERPEVGAVVHAHPIHATGFATAGIALDECIAAEIIATLGSVPLAPYGTPSTHELPETLRSHIHRADAMLLANHGVVTMGRDLHEAYFRLERIEHYAQIVLVARQLGGPQLLSQPQVMKLFSLREKYRQTGLNPGCASCEDACVGGSCPNYAVKYDPNSPDRLNEIVERVLRRL